jgi:hypothetical protein
VRTHCAQYGKTKNVKKKLKKWKLQQVQQEKREARDTVIRNGL